MADVTGLSQFAEQLRGEVISRAFGGGEDGDDVEFKENVFTTLAAEYLAESGAIDDAETCYFSRRTGKGILKVNAYGYDDETKQLDLFVTCYMHGEVPSKLQKAEVTRPLEQLVRFFRAATNGLHNEMEPAHDDYTMVERICEAGPETERIRCFFLTDGLSPISSLPPIDVDGVTVRFEIWDVERLYRASLAYNPQGAITINFVERFGAPLKCLRVEEDLGDYTAFVTIMPGNILSDLYDEFGSRLLELNVRSFLQAKGKVNRSIRETLKTAPERFLAYNNGISATAEYVELLDTKGGASLISLIRDLQVVNGGQTTASIHRAQKEDKVDVSRVFVQAKIAVVARSHIEEIVPLISRFSNSQNAVREADFSANDSFHIEIERLSETIWCPGEQSRWFYERARGQYQVAKAREATTLVRRHQFESKCPSSQKFTKTDLAKYVHSWEQLPHLVSKGAQKNFVEFMLRLKSHCIEWQPDAVFYKELVARAILCRRTERIVRQLRIPAYGANVITYTISYLSYRCAGRLDLVKIWNQQELSIGTSEAIRVWVPMIYEAIVESSSGRNVTEWAKKEECWRYIRSLSIGIPDGLARELAEIQPVPNVGASRFAGKRGTSQADAEKIARVMQVPAEVWFRISDWGRRSGTLKAWQAGIAHTLSGYASDNWEKVPSVKQANQAIKILELASGEFEDLPT